MKGTVLISNLDMNFAGKLAAVFIREGFRVFAMGDRAVEGVTLLPDKPAEAAAVLKNQAGKLDFLLDTADVQDPGDRNNIREGINRKVVERIYRKNVLNSMALLEAFLPLLEEGEAKRLFYLTRAGASINETRSVSSYGYNMTKMALHQFLHMTYNKLRPKGYTFRVFDPMDTEIPAELAAESAFNYITRRRGTENDDPTRDDENNLFFRDAQGRQHSW